MHMHYAVVCVGLCGSVAKEKVSMPRCQFLKVSLAETNNNQLSKDYKQDGKQSLSGF